MGVSRVQSTEPLGVNMFDKTTDAGRFGAATGTLGRAARFLLLLLVMAGFGCGSGGAVDQDTLGPGVCQECLEFAVCDEEAQNPCLCPVGYEGDGTTGGTGCSDIDECASGESVCVAGLTTCTNTIGTFKCRCAEGYEGDGRTDGTGCVDIDECAQGADDCVGEHGTCNNTGGGFLCGCDDGFTGDGTVGGSGCNDINECAEGLSGCAEIHGICTNTVGGFTCECEDGYSGDATEDGTGCNDINECQEGLDTCVDEGGSCTNTDGGFTCGCKPGFEGDGNSGGTGCTDINECELGTAGCVEDMALCVNLPGGFECECVSGYGGDGTASGSGCSDINECELQTDDCVDSPVGICVNQVGGYACGCRAGFHGDGVVSGTGCADINECDLGIDDCVPVAAECENSIGGYVCHCGVGYGGDGKEGGTGCVDVNECETGVATCIAAPMGTCTNTPGDYLCGCAPGYLGDGRVAGVGCTDINECELGTHNCDPAVATCQNLAGGYTCACAPGFEGDGSLGGAGCTDLNECEKGTDLCVAAPAGVCVNTVGSYECACGSGFEGDGWLGGEGCVDLDECDLGTDDCVEWPGLCFNLPGGYECGCDTGYEGDGWSGGTGCLDVDECALGTYDCFEPTGLCSNVDGGYLCYCQDGYEGDGWPLADGGSGCVLQNPRLTMPKRMVNDKPLTLRAEILLNEAQIDVSGCFDEMGTVTMTRLSDGVDVPLTVTVFDEHLPIPEDSIRFYHGVGSVSFTLDAATAVPAGEYVVTVSVSGLVARKNVVVMDSPAWRVMPGVLTGDNLTWGPNENIRISEHLTQVPAGETLRILPGTLVMVDTTGSLEDGTMIDVLGNIEAEGTLGNPIAFFSERGPEAMLHTISGSLSNADAWRGVNLLGSGSSVFRWVMLTGAGNGLVISHPRPPIMNMRDTTNAVFEDCVFVDSTGMVFQTPGTGSYTIRRTLVSRVGIGGEFLSSGHTLLIEDSFWTGIGRGPSTPMRFDGDGIHIDGYYSDQTIRRCIVSDIGDDGFDHSNSTFRIEDTVIHDVNDKGCSMTNGFGTFVNVLMFNTGTGIRGTAEVFNSTISAQSPINVPQVVQSSIIWPTSVWSCSGDIDFSLLGSAADLGCGEGNFTSDPVFSAPDQCDYTPAPGSPALSAGPDGGRIGWQGYPVIAPWIAEP